MCCLYVFLAEPVMSLLYIYIYIYILVSLYTSEIVCPLAETKRVVRLTVRSCQCLKQSCHYPRTCFPFPWTVTCRSRVQDMDELNWFYSILNAHSLCIWHLQWCLMCERVSLLTCQLFVCSTRRTGLVIAPLSLCLVTLRESVTCWGVSAFAFVFSLDSYEHWWESLPDWLTCYLVTYCLTSPHTPTSIPF